MKKVGKPRDIYTSRGITIRVKSMDDVLKQEISLVFTNKTTAHPFKRYCRIDENIIHRCKAMHWLINVHRVQYLIMSCGSTGSALTMIRGTWEIQPCRTSRLSNLASNSAGSQSSQTGLAFYRVRERAEDGGGGFCRCRIFLP